MAHPAQEALLIPTPGPISANLVHECTESIPAATRPLEFGHCASRRDAAKIARHFSAGIVQQYEDESRRDG